MNAPDTRLIAAITAQFETHGPLELDELVEELARIEILVARRDLRMVLIETPRFRKDGDGYWHLVNDEQRNREADTQGAGLGPTSPRASSLDAERGLRERLRGCRLVAEIGLAPETLAESERVVAESSRTRSALALARICPASLVTYLVGHGVYHYDGRFWPTLAVAKDDTNEWGLAFEESVRRLELETFEDMVLGEGALRYVAPILAHGGVPANSLDGYFKLLRKHLGDVDDATDLLALWRTRRSPFAEVHKPVRRFLLYGGDLAVDLIDRSLDLFREYARSGSVPTAQAAGLPEYVVEAFRRHVEDEPGVLIDTPRRAKAPRPWLELDPWSATGLVLVLPSLPSEVEATSWRLQTDNHFERFETSRLKEREVALPPARAWTVSLLNGERVVSQLTAEGLDEFPALFIDPSSHELLRPAGGIRLSTVWILRPSDLEITGIQTDGARSAPRVIEHLPTPSGAWSGFELVSIDLDGLRALELTLRRAGAPAKRVLVRSPAEKPVILTEPVARAHTSDGSPIYLSAPEIHLPAGSWVIRCTVNGEQRPPQELELPEAGTIALDLPHGLCSVDLDVRGPLGADLRATFTVCAGLAINRPSSLIDGSREESVSVGGPDLSIDGGPIGAMATLAIPTHSDEVRWSVSDARDRSADLIARVRKVLWALDQSTAHGVSFGNTPVDVDEAELAGTDPIRLLVRTGQPELPLELHLCCAGEVLQRTERVATRGEDGRWVFDLTRFYDTVRTAASSDLTFQLWVGPRPMTVARVRRHLDVLDIRGDSRRDGGRWVLDVTFDLRQHLTDRVLRLWPLNRPWEPPIERPIPDNEVDHLTVTGESRLIPGLYMAEIVVDSGWTSAPRRRPDRSDHILGVGDRADFRDFVDSITADSDVLDRLQRVLVTGSLEGELSNDDWQRIGVPAVEVAAAIASGTLPRHDVHTRGFTALKRLLSENPTWLARSAPRAVEEGRVEPSQLLALGIELAGALVKNPVRNLPESEMRALWSVAPSLAAPLDFCQLDRPEVAARVHEFTGWEPEPKSTPPFGEPMSQQYIGMGLEQVEAIPKVLDLLPNQILSLDALVIAHFEWLIAEKSGSGPSPRQWLSAHRSLLDAPLRVGVFSNSSLTARRPERGTDDLGLLPVVSMKAALAVVTDSPQALQARAALHEAIRFAPRLVRRDLVLAHAVTALDRAEETRD